MSFPIQAKQLTTEEKAILGKLLVEALTGEVTGQTRDAVATLNDIPEPFGHLVRYTWGYGLDGLSLATDLTEEIRGVCVELLDPNYPPAE